MVDISVVMGVYTDAISLPATIENVLSQTGVDLEFVIVDDGSTDHSGSILETYARQDARIKVLHQANSGLTVALINACKVASGRFVARQDVGDLSLPSRLQRQQEALDENPGWVFVSSRWELKGPAGEPLFDPLPADMGAQIVSSLTAADPSGMCGPHHGSVMFRREAYEAVGGYRSEFYFAQDLDLWSRLIEVGGLGFVDEVLYEVTFKPDSITGRWAEEQQKTRECIIEAARLRRSGKAEDTALERAGRIRPAGKMSPVSRNNGLYFIASCLADRGDKRAINYFLRHVRTHPLDLKAYAKLAHSVFRSATGLPRR